MTIQSFSDEVTEEFFFSGKLPPKGCGWANVDKVAARKLDMIDAASQLLDLRVPPGNRLKRLKGELEGWHSIRINDQWRVIFVWSEAGPEKVAITDYH